MRRTDPRASTLLELSDALTEQMQKRHDRATSAWNVHLTYSRRAAMALHSNDLALALRSAEIAAEAHHIFNDAEQRDDPELRKANLERYETRAAEYRASQRAARLERAERRSIERGDTGGV